MSRILTVTLNAALDTTYVVDNFQAGEVHRVRQKYTQAGGKGINVARTIHRLGGTVTATGFVGGDNGQTIIRKLQEEGIDAAFCEVPEGESRICLSIIDESYQKATEILEPGLHVTAGQMERLKRRLQSLITPGMIVVFSGSLPPGLPMEEWRSLLRFVRQRGARVVVDTSGTALAAAIACQPSIITPNQHEFAALTKADAGEQPAAPSLQHWRKPLADLVLKGIDFPIITLGDQGAVAYHRSIYYHVPAPQVDVVNPVGSGDAFMGGLLWSLANGSTAKRALATAVAAGAANAAQPVAGMVDRNAVTALADHVLDEIKEEGE